MLKNELWLLKSAAPMGELASRAGEFALLESQLLKVQRIDASLATQINTARRNELQLDRERQPKRQFDDDQPPPPPRSANPPRRSQGGSDRPDGRADDRSDRSDDDDDDDPDDDPDDGAAAADAADADADDDESSDDGRGDGRGEDRDDDDDDEPDDEPDDDAGAALLVAPGGFVPVAVAELRSLAGATGFLQSIEAKRCHVLYYDCGTVLLALVKQFKSNATRGDNFVLEIDGKEYAHRLNIEAYQDPAPSQSSDGDWLYLRHVVS
mmetsp:Transcript_14763/g.52586  ORF Transcript_14763/g.52586 Transcript_14763/m.52586 type:complete len:267 (-) Transcript_14763:101-901(-)